LKGAVIRADVMFMTADGGADDIMSPQLIGNVLADTAWRPWSFREAERPERPPLM
jgi:hypothetical protein